VKKHTRIKVGDDVVEVEGCFGVEGWDDTKGGNDLKVLVTFVNEGKIGALGTDSEVCI